MFAGALPIGVVGLASAGLLVVDAGLTKTTNASLNRAIWYSATGFTQPYPGDGKILTPIEVDRDDD